MLNIFTYQVTWDSKAIGSDNGNFTENWNDPNKGLQQGNSLNNVPSPSHDETSWDDDNSDGLPVGFLVVLFIALALFAYSRKSQSQSDSRGRYQRWVPQYNGSYIH